MDCSGSGSLVINSTCTNSLGTSVFNISVGDLVANSAADNTVVIWHPSISENISCQEQTSPFQVTFRASYDANARIYRVSGPWIDTAIGIGQSVQGCYQGSNCGEAQANMSLGNAVSISYSRNSSGGITTTITNNVYMAGSLWLSSRPGGSCSVGFTS